MDLESVLILRYFVGRRTELARRLRRGPPAPAEVQLARDALPRRDRARIEAQVRAVALLGVHFVPAWAVPEALATVLAPALGLFVRGDPTALGRPSLSVVGARRASPPARAWAAEVATAAVREGLQVVSGGARGIDGAAHRAACDAGGRSLAFIGVGIDRFYPSVHRALFARMLEQGGAVVSEHPPGEGGRPYDHAARNRFIAAAGHALWVAEAGERSGTLGTARQALKLGRPVWLSPPGVARLRGGLDQLRNEGATIASCPEFTVAEAKGIV